MDDSDIPTLVTDRLLLRPPRRGDLDDYAALYADPAVTRYLSGGRPWDRDRSWRHLAFLLGHWRLGGTGTWVVERRGTGAFLGTVGFTGPDGWPGCELAWFLAPRFWGRGYATEGARAALAHAFEVLGQERVISLIHPGNRASLRVAERLGETLLGALDQPLGERLCYGIDRARFLARRAAHPAEPGEAAAAAVRPPLGDSGPAAFGLRD